MRTLLSTFLFVSAAAAQVEPDKVLKTMTAGEGLQVELFAAEPMLVNPTNIDIDPLGRVWVTEAVNYRCHLRKKPLNREEGDRIVILTDKDGDGKADESTVFYQGKELYGPLGICLIPQMFDKKLGFRVLVSQSPDILEFWDRDGDGKADGPPTKFLSGFGGFDHDHGVHSIQVGPDGKFYFTVGDAGFKDLKSPDGKQTYTQNKTTMQAGTVWRCNADGKNLELIAHNFRNPYEACVDSFGEIWLSDNDDDGNQQTRICHVLPGGNYGYWPRGKGESHWHEEQPGIVHKTLRTGFGSPTGITCYEGTLLPEKFRGQLIHADAGPREIRCFHKKPKGAGYELDKTLMLTSSDNWFRPSDVCVAPDGSVFVSDWYDPGVGGHGMGDTTRGRIYRITPAGHKGYKVNGDLATTSLIASACQSNRATGIGMIRAMKPDDAVQTLQTLFGMNGDRSFSARVMYIMFAGINVLESRAPKVIEASTPIMKSDPVFEKVAVRAQEVFGRKCTAEFYDPSFDKEIAAIPLPLKCEMMVNNRIATGKQLEKLFFVMAKSFDGDRTYLAALNIACGTDPARREAILADFDKHFPAWNDTVAELVFELRPKCYMAKLDALLKDPNLSAKQKGRIVDILATDANPDAGKTVLSLLATDADLDVKARAINNLRLFLPGKWSGLKTSKEMKHAVDATIAKFSTKVVGYELAALAKDERHLPEIRTLADDKSSYSDERRAALAALVGFRDLSTLRSVMCIRNDPAAPLAASLLGQIANVSKPDDDAKRALEYLVAKIEKNDLETKELTDAILAALAASKAGTQFLLDRQAAGKLRPELVSEAGRLLRNSPFQGERNKALILFPAAAKLDLSKLVPADLARRTGNAEAGRKVFLASFKGDAQCMKCHKVKNEGGEIGPDLSAIGKKASREDLYNSILTPSKAIADQFVTWKVESDSGASVNGLIVKETPTELVIRDANGKDHTFDPKGVEKKKTPTSLMADDIAKPLTEQELTDLVEYLFSLKE